MILKQKRIRNLSKLSGIKEGSKIFVAKVLLENTEKLAQKIGFSKKLEIGEIVLPKVIGPVTRRNAEGVYIIHKDKEKETCVRMVMWTRKQWAGRGRTEEVTDLVDVPYKRYPRTFVPPNSIELKIVEKNGSKFIVSPEIEFSIDNKNLIIHVVNLFLEIFGECEILDSNTEPIQFNKVIRLNWEVLPKGKYPWEIQKKRIEPFLKKSKGKNREVIEKRIEKINEYSPDFTALGRAGFNGYIVFGFERKNIYILESTKINNATYVLENNWKTLSQLSKAELLQNNLHKYRIIHNKRWFEDIENILSK